MSYFFPGIITNTSLKHPVNEDLMFHVNSAANAISLVLKSYALPPLSNVAIPYFVCDSVREAVQHENLTPVTFDLKDGHTFWTDYNTATLTENKISALVLVHLYGYIHPDTEAIAEFCTQNKIRLIHDVAQGYGIDESKLKGGGAIIYSFGPGKSTIAAEGGLVAKMDEPFYRKHVKTIRPNTWLHWIANQRAKIFIRSRSYEYKSGRLQQVWKKIIFKLHHSSVGNSFFSMTKYQLSMASYIISQLSSLGPERKLRYHILKEALTNHPLLHLPEENGEGLYFKVVVFNFSDNQKLIEHLKANHVPFFRLIDEQKVKLATGPQSINFRKNGACIFEFSSEASIPLEEIKRMAHVLKSYH